MQINSKYILVDNKKSLELAVVNLSNSKVIAIDTESLSDIIHIYSKVCLVQISANGKTSLLIRWHRLDIKALDVIFKNPSILKFFILPLMTSKH